MCGNCENEPYRGVRALFNGDLQAKQAFEDRVDWTVLSPNVIVYLGESSLANEQSPLFRGCEQAINSLTTDVHLALSSLSKQLHRPRFEQYP